MLTSPHTLKLFQTSAACACAEGIQSSLPLHAGQQCAIVCMRHHGAGSGWSRTDATSKPNPHCAQVCSAGCCARSGARQRLSHGVLNSGSQCAQTV